jgi:acetyl esterase/lipase
MLDAARAARHLDTGAGGRVVLHGHSEGGHAVLWVAELVRSYAPELQLLGVAASAPGAELAATMKAADTRPATLTSGAMLIVVAWSDAYHVPLGVLTAAGRKAVDRVRSTCLQELAAGPTLAAVRPSDLLTTPPWPALLARNTPGQAATPAPVLIAQGADDEVATPATSRALVQRLCRLGDTVELRTYQGVGHFDVLQVASTEMVGWTGARLAGRLALFDLPTLKGGFLRSPLRARRPAATAGRDPGRTRGTADDGGPGSGRGRRSRWTPAKPCSPDQITRHCRGGRRPVPVDGHLRDDQAGCGERRSSTGT